MCWGGFCCSGHKAECVAFQQSLNKHPLQDLSMPGPIPHVALVVWKVSVAADVIVCNKFCNKVKVELACCCVNARGKRTLGVEKQPSDKVYSCPTLSNRGCQVGSRWSACLIKKYSCFPRVRFSFFSIHRFLFWLNSAFLKASRFWASDCRKLAKEVKQVDKRTDRDRRNRSRGGFWSVYV